MRRALLAAYAVYLLSAAYLVFWPQPDTPAGAVSEIVSLLEAVGTTFISGTVIEFLLNVALFVPLTLLGILIWPRLNPFFWLALGIGGTLLIEFAQWAVLPDRSGTAIDLVSNSLGALIGIDLGLRISFRQEHTRSS